MSIGLNNRAVDFSRSNEDAGNEPTHNRRSASYAPRPVRKRALPPPARETLSGEPRSYEIIIPTRPRRDLLERCFDAIRRHGLPLRVVSVARADDRGNRQLLTIETGVCSAGIAAAVARDLTTDEAPRIRENAPASVRVCRALAG